jgi:hypothetical protein
MSEDSTFKKILISNSWQENLNIWRFSDQTIEITPYANPKFVDSFLYQIDKALDGRFIIITPKTFFGHLLVTVKFDNAQPKLILEWDNSESKVLELEAFQGFRDQDVKLVEGLVEAIRTKFQLKQDELNKANINRQKNSNSLQRDRKMRSIALKVEMLQIVVQSTVNLATNFRAYHESVTSDVAKIENELDQVK